MPIGATIGAIGALGSAGIGAIASSSAADKQAALGNQALNQQLNLFNQGKGALDPFIQAGQSVLPTLQDLLTPGKSAATLSSLPGVQFQSQYGTMAATNALAAKTGPSAGPLATAISQYNQGLAGTTYQNQVGNLQNFANLGAGSANALAGNATSTGANVGGTLTGIGNAQAAGTLGTANALAGGVTGAANAGTNAMLLSRLLGTNGASNFSQPNNGTGIYAGDPNLNLAGFGPTNFAQ